MSADNTSGPADKKGARITRAEIVHQLSRGLGEQRAEEVVGAAAKQLKFDGDEYDRRQAIAILDHLAAATGVVGTVARFAKARIALDLDR